MIDSPIEDQYRLSPMQQGLLFHTLSDPESGVYIGQVVCPLGPHINRAAFRRAWQRAIDRHAILRTSFEWDGLAEPVQRVHRQVVARIEQHDWRGLNPAERQACLGADRRHGFDLRTAPLMRMALAELPGGEAVCVWTHHHILLDGRSRVIVLKDVARFYDAEVEGRAFEPSAAPAFRDYLDWMWAQSPSGAREYWRQLLASVDPPSLPWSRPADASLPEPGAAVRQIELSPSLQARLHGVARQLRVTVNMLVQGAWAVLLARYTGRPDVVFGVTRSCRRARFDGAPAVVGVLMNTLPVRVQVDPRKPFIVVLDELRAQHVAGREFQHTPLPQVRQWSGASPGTELFDSIIIFEERDLHHALQSEDASLWRNGAQRSVHTHYPVTLAGYTKPSLRLEINYSRRCLDEAAASRLAAHLVTLLEALAADTRQPCGELPMLTPAEHVQIFEEWNDTTEAVPRGTLPTLVEAQVSRSPAAVAAVCEDRAVTYGALNEQANRLAHLLIANGIGPEDLVGVAMPRSLELLVALLATLKAGAAYLPIDPGYPGDRLRLMLDDARPSCVMTADHLTLPSCARQIALADPAIVDALARSRTGNPTDADRSRPLTDRNLAYVIYTSGSTGVPKGVAVSHGAIVNKVWTLSGRLGFSPATRFAALSSITFDPLLDQVFCPLCRGGTIVVVPDVVREDPDLLRAYATHHRVTVLNATPGFVERVMEYGDVRLDTLMIGADVLPSRLARHVRTGRAARVVVNLYGPTETCINASMFEAAGALEVETVPIGAPLPNYRIYVLGPGGRPLPANVVGELYIAGAGLARGYLNRPALTAERFVPDPYGPRGTLMYRTGDLGRWREDGNLEFVGRTDNQVKIRGFRIEPGEIESVLAQHPALKRALVAAQPGPSADRRLVAYVAPVAGADVSESELRGFLTSRLPAYLVPSAFVVLAEIPLTPHGKVDVRALPAAPARSADRGWMHAEPRTAVEDALVRIWRQVLGAEDAGACDDFFDLGGDSLSAMQVVSRVRDLLGVELSMRALFSSPTVRGLAESIERLRARESPVAARAVPADESARPVLA